MKFLVFNLSVAGSSVVEAEFDKILKGVPYAVKSCIKNQKVDYSYILAPIIKKNNQPTEYFMIKDKILSSTNKEITEDIYYSIFKVLYSSDFDLSKQQFTIDIVNIIEENQLGITYTDGSFKKSTSECSYACFQLTESLTETEYNILKNNNPENEEYTLDNITGKYFKSKSFSGIIKEGTNNVGEINGIRKAAENFNDRKYQIIISDSEYSIKIFREYIYNWQKNGYKTYSKKPIANEQLIKETFNELSNSNRIKFYCWTKGHSNKESFNEKCDKLAKKELDIK